MTLSIPSEFRRITSHSACCLTSEGSLYIISVYCTPSIRWVIDLLPEPLSRNLTPYFFHDVSLASATNVSFIKLQFPYEVSRLAVLNPRVRESEEGSAKHVPVVFLPTDASLTGNILVVVPRASNGINTAIYLAPLNQIESILADKQLLSSKLFTAKWWWIAIRSLCTTVWLHRFLSIKSQSDREERLLQRHRSGTACVRVSWRDTDNPLEHSPLPNGTVDKADSVLRSIWCEALMSRVTSIVT